jgi:hypothetical protein
MLTRSIIALSPIVLASAALATPTFSSIGTSWGNEADHATILGNIYGGTWTKVGTSNDYTNGTLTAVRVSDAGRDALNLLTENANQGSDQEWNATTPLSVTVRAKYAGDTHTLGWIESSKAPSGFTDGYLAGVHTFADSSNLGYTTTINPGGSFVWTLNDNTNKYTLTSREANNRGVNDYRCDAFDALTSYQIVGLNTPGKEWALFWEDLRKGGSDMDYNDSVFTVHTQAIPTPAAVTLGALGSGVLMARRRR